MSLRILALVLFNCVELIWGTYISNEDFTIISNQDFTNITKRDVPILYEKCYGDLSTQNSYHIQLLDLHQHSGMGSATACGDPQGSPHYNLHFDMCIPGKTPPCNNCIFPFTTWEQYSALRDRYLVEIHNWHAFSYTVAGYQCLCLWDSVTGTKYDNCFDTDVKDALLTVVSDVAGLAQEIWGELVDLPWQAKAGIIALVTAAVILLLPLIIDVLIAAGVKISADLIAEAGAALLAKFGETISNEKTIPKFVFHNLVNKLINL